MQRQNRRIVRLSTLADFCVWIPNLSISVLIQKSILVDPSSTSRAAASTSTELLDAQRQAEELRDTVNRQSREIELLEGRMSEMKKAMEGEVSVRK